MASIEDQGASAATIQSIHTIQSIRSITRRYYTVYGINSLGPSFIFAIYPLFLRARGLNQFQINSVAAVFFLVLFLTDVPTGAIADTIGRRMSFVFGCILSAAAFVFYYFAHQYWMFIVAEIVDGIGTTFRNGAVDAWAVDSLDAAGFAGTKDRLFSRVQQIWRFGSMAGALTGAYIARSDIALPWILGAIGFAQQKGNMLVGGLDKPAEHQNRMGEFLDEFEMFLVAPGRSQV